MKRGYGGGESGCARHGQRHPGVMDVSDLAVIIAPAVLVGPAIGLFVGILLAWTTTLALAVQPAHH